MGDVTKNHPDWIPRIREMARRTSVRLSCEESELGSVCADLFRAFDTDKNGFLDAAEATMLLGSALQASVRAGGFLYLS